MCFISQSNLYIFNKASVITFQKETLEKLLFDIFHITTLNFFNITFMVYPSTKWSVVLPMFADRMSSAQQLNQTFMVAYIFHIYKTG